MLSFSSENWKQSYDNPSSIMFFDYYYPNTRDTSFSILLFKYSNVYKNGKFRKIIQDRYASDRTTCEEIMGAEFATNEQKA